MKEFFKKHREFINYIFFGIITTIVSFAIYFIILAIAEHGMSMNVESGEFYIVRLIAQILQWVGGVLVAFYTNKKWVFRSKSISTSQTVGELLTFATMRFGTLLMDTAITMSVVWILQMIQYQPFKFIIEITPDVWAKGIAGVVVIVANYIFSKYIIFKNKKKKSK